MRLVTVTVLVTIAAVVASPGAAAADAACGPHQLRGATVRTFCGSARATVVVAGKTIRIRGGACEIVNASGITAYTVNAGTYTIPRAKPRATSFSAAGSELKPGGPYTGWLVNFQTPGRQWTLRPTTTKVTIGAKGRSGTFSGTLYEGGKTAKGSWSC
jgi:hypothetical protein